MSVFQIKLQPKYINAPPKLNILFVVVVIEYGYFVKHLDKVRRKNLWVGAILLNLFSKHLHY